MFLKKPCKILRRFSEVKLEVEEKRYMFPRELYSSLNKIEFNTRNQMTIGEEYNFRLDYSEVQARIYKHLRHFIKDLRGQIMAKPFENLLQDEFERISLMTSLEREFGIILPENVFENINSLDQFAKFIIQDGKAY